VCEALLVRVLSIADDLMSLLRGGREVGERVGERSKDEDFEGDGNEERRSCQRKRGTTRKFRARRLRREMEFSLRRT